MNRWLRETILEGKLVKLIPLIPDHRNDLILAATDGALWNLWYTSVPSEALIDDYLDYAFQEKTNGRAMPFAVIDKKTGAIIGSTRYCNATPEHKRLEIGFTWYAKSFQRTGVNTECKYLLLSYAFEMLNCIAVEFRTHVQNLASREAILRIGAKQDGILRNHQFSRDGSIRDTVVFSITDKEWEGVKSLLLSRMNRNTEDSIDDPSNNSPLVHNESPF